VSGLRVALVGGPMYDRLYELLPADVEIVVHADHPTLNREVAARLARGERIDVLSTHGKYAPSQSDWLLPLDDLVRRGGLHRHVTKLDPRHVDEHGGTHGRPGGRGRRHRRSATSGARTTPTQAEPPGYANSARLSARMVML
jgi:hypothetical protein